MTFDIKNCSDTQLWELLKDISTILENKDNTDSMYAKLFTKDDEEFVRIKDLIKNGK